MTTKLADVIVPEEYAPYEIARTEEISPLLNSAAVRTDPTFSEFLAGGGQTVEVPNWNPTWDDTQESNVSDDSDNDADVDKANSHADAAVRHNRNKHWGAKDLAGQLAGSDPIDAIATQTGEWWGLDIQQTMLASLQGVLADNIANNAGDMVHSVATDAAGAPTAAELISAEAIIDAMQTMGDSQMDIALIGMHSVCMTTLNKLNLIDFIPDWRGEINQPTYLGKPIVITDQIRPVMGTNRPTYTTYLFGAGSVAWAQAPAKVPVEVDRQPLTGNGGGGEILSTRRQYIIHPAGIRYNGAVQVGPSPTNTELLDATNWTRVRPERKQVKIAFLQTNG